MGIAIFYALVIAVANLAVDLLCAVVDPRIRYRSVHHWLPGMREDCAWGSSVHGMRRWPAGANGCSDRTKSGGLLSTP
jgi:hypothetical protein